MLNLKLNYADRRLAAKFLRRAVESHRRSIKFCLMYPVNDRKQNAAYIAKLTSEEAALERIADTLMPRKSAKVEGR